MGLLLVCLRTTWRTETISAIKTNDISFIPVNNQIFASIKVKKSKTNQCGETFVYSIDPNDSDKNLCLVNLLQKYLTIFHGKNWKQKENLLFLNKNNEKLKSTDVTIIINEMTKKANIKEKFSSKSLRTGAVAWMLESGFTIENIKALGWSETSTAFNCYIRNTANAMKGGTSKMFK